jgi:hypothetical protein
LIAKRFIVSGLRISAQFLCKSLCDLYCRTVLLRSPVLREKGIKGQGMEKQESFVIFDQNNLGLHTFWCRGDGEGSRHIPETATARITQGFFPSGSGRGFLLLIMSKA